MRGSGYGRLAAALLACGAVLSACGSGSEGPSHPGSRIGEAGPVPGAPAVRSGSEVRVIDADTVDIDGTRYRLFGIDAPESDQTCRTWGRTWDCGAAATEALKARAEGMSCSGGSTDRYGRVLGVCSSGGEDLNAWLVANGWALAYRQYADDYGDEEDEARANRRGIHRGAFVAPWNWRRDERLDGEDTFSRVASGSLDAGALADRLLRGEAGAFDGRFLNESVFGLAEGGIAVSFGAWSGANPAGTGGAVWRGSMVGMDGGRRIAGDAEIGIDNLARPEADIAFTGIVEADGASRADMRWEDISVARGAFEASDAGGSIEGRFYGSDREEVGGIFERSGIVGAFGAAKE